MKDGLIRVAVLGAAGRMGRIVSEMFASSPQFELAARIDCRCADGNAAGAVPMPAMISDLAAAPEFDILVDFSSPDASRQAIDEMRRRRAAWLVATTGISDGTLAEIAALGAAQPVLTASNTSLGIALMQRLAAQAAAVLAQWDCEIVETHHRNKIDAPSGTAKTLAETVNRARSAVLGEAAFVFDRTARREPRPSNEIGISSLRGGTVAGQHQIVWFGAHEQFEIRHAAENRDIFARGAVKIAAWLAAQKPGLYSVDRLLDDIL